MKFLGCGTGKCGSTSLWRLIDGCNWLTIKHERHLTDRLLPYVYDRDRIDEAVDRFKKVDNYGEIGFHYLPYIPNFIAAFPDIKIICLQRDIGETYQSYRRNSLRNHPWATITDGYFDPNDTWDECYPKYGSHIDWEFKPAFYRFWSDYYHRAGVYERLWPNFKIFPIESLNSHKGQESIFKFIGVPKQYRVYKKECRYNVTK